MNHDLSGKKIAILIANGFMQSDVTAAQRMFQDTKAKIHLVSCENGVVNGWEGNGWGHHYPSDVSLGKALAADYDAVVIPGGLAHVEKLLKTEHTKRFVGGFMRAQKVVVTFAEGVKTLIETGMVRDYEMTGPESVISDMNGEGVIVSSEMMCVDDHVITAQKSGEMYDEIFSATADAILAYYEEMSAAA